MNQIVAGNKKLQSDMVVIKSPNHKLEEKDSLSWKKSGKRGAI